MARTNLNKKVKKGLESVVVEIPPFHTSLFRIIECGKTFKKTHLLTIHKRVNNFLGGILVVIYQKLKGCIFLRSMKPYYKDLFIKFEPQQ